LWLTVNFAVVCPAETVTVAGTAAAALELDSLTTRPPTGAIPLSLTVPVTVVEEFPITVPGLTTSDTSTGAWMVRAACFEAPPWVAVIVALVSWATAFVDTTKLAPDSPAATLTEFADRMDEGLFDERAILSPPVGAGPVSQTVPKTCDPPSTVAGDTDTLYRATAWLPGRTVRLADWVI